MHGRLRNVGDERLEEFSRFCENLESNNEILSFIIKAFQNVLKIDQEIHDGSKDPKKFQAAFLNIIANGGAIEMTTFLRENVRPVETAQIMLDPDTIKTAISALLKRI